jgi:hypothetical protein
MKKLSTILKPTVLKEDAENACEDAMTCLTEIITMSQNLMEGLQDVSEDLDENMMNCISETRDKIKDACECALEAYGFDACCETCDDEEEVEEEKESDEEDPGISKDDETKFHKKLDDLVHSTFGKRMDETMESSNLKEANFNGSLKSLGFIEMTDAEVKRAYYKWASKINLDFKGWEQPMGKYAVGWLKGDGHFFIVNKRKPSEIDFYSGEKAVLNALRNLNLEESALSEAKTIDAPEEKGLNDYVMPKSVIKMIAKQQFSQVKTKSKLFDTVATLDKTKDLVHLFTSKKHKNILLGMFKIGKKASFFIHDTESTKANKLDNVGRYKDTKGFSDALSALFEKKKEDSVKKK